MDEEVSRILESHGLPVTNDYLLKGEPPEVLDNETLRAFRQGRLSERETSRVIFLITHYQQCHDLDQAVIQEIADELKAKATTLELDATKRQRRLSSIVSIVVAASLLSGMLGYLQFRATDETLFVDNDFRIVRKDDGSLIGLPDDLPKRLTDWCEFTITNSKFQLSKSAETLSNAALIATTRDELDSWCLPFFPVNELVTGEVISFSWKEKVSADQYTLFLYADTGERILRTESVTNQLKVNLQPGRYIWEVLAQNATGNPIEPPLSSSKTAFIVAGEDVLQMLSEDLKKADGSHFINAVIYAHHGFKSKAKMELDVLRRTNSESEFVKTLRESLNND